MVQVPELGAPRSSPSTDPPATGSRASWPTSPSATHGGAAAVADRAALSTTSKAARDPAAGTPRGPGRAGRAVRQGHRAGEYEERELLMSFADQAALALDRAQALEDRAELAVISDRDRIARDLHDLVIQRLFATGLQLQGIRSVSETPAVNERIDETVDALDLTIKDIRSTIFELQDRQAGSLRSRDPQAGEGVRAGPRLRADGAHARPGRHRRARADPRPAPGRAARGDLQHRPPCARRPCRCRAPGRRARSGAHRHRRRRRSPRGPASRVGCATRGDARRRSAASSSVSRGRSPRAPRSCWRVPLP